MLYALPVMSLPNVALIRFGRRLMTVHIHLELLATLKRYLPESPDRFPVRSGITVKELIGILGIPEYEVNLVFINGARGNLDTTPTGDVRVGLFPPLGGG